MSETATEEQACAINAPLNRHIKVVAVAGSGKSFMLRHRVQYLLDSGVNQKNIIVLMFNEKARAGFQSKLTSMLPAQPLPKVRTFHSLGNRVCKTLEGMGVIEKRELITFEYKLNMLAKNVLSKVVGANSNSACSPNKPGVIEKFVGFIDLVKTNLAKPETQFRNSGLVHEYIPFVDAFNLFEKTRKERAERFFIDLLYDSVMALKESEKGRQFYDGLLKHIIIDEYQDINHISQELIKLLAGDTAMVTVVGDDDQTLYGFRGSKPDYLINGFDKDFPDPIVYKLTKTFRYGHIISLASNNVISRNHNRTPKTCISDYSTPKTILELQVEPEETAKKLNSQKGIILPIQNWLSKGGKLSDVAILVRLYSMTPEIELALLSHGLPYKIEGRPPVFQIPEVVALTALLELANGSITNHDQSKQAELMTSILQFPSPYLPTTEIQEIALAMVADWSQAVKTLYKAAASKPSYVATRLNRKGRAIDEVIQSAKTRPADILQTYINTTDCFNAIKRSALDADESEAIIGAIEAFIGFCEAKESAGEVLYYIDSITNKTGSTTTDSLLITSIHRAKGLEWPLVILPKLSHHLFPHSKGDEKPDIPAERRLFYVGMTRAINHLVLVVPKDKALGESINSGKCEIPKGINNDKSYASQFVYEAQLRHCILLGDALYRQSEEVNLNPVADLDIYNNYLTKANAAFRISR